MALTNREFWRAVYLAAIRAGQADWQAEQAADKALKEQPKK
jgi:hypothetical protein